VWATPRTGVSSRRKCSSDVATSCTNAIGEFCVNMNSLTYHLQSPTSSDRYSRLCDGSCGPRPERDW
jgi:hypothetical protein